MLASGTEIVHALGLSDRIVGISHECDFPPDLMGRPRLSAPRFDPEGMDSGQVDRAVRSAMAEHGSVYRIDGDLLERLRPDLILTQAVCEVCAVPTPGVRAEVERRGLSARVLSLDAHSMEGILQTVEAVAEAAGAPERGARLRADLEARMERVRRALAGRSRPRVLALEWLDPPFSPGHWVPEMVSAAGGECLLGQPGARSREVDWRELAGLEPDVLVVMPCGYDVEAAQRDADAHADRLFDVAGEAVTAGRAWIVNGSAYFNRSGPRFVRGIEILGGLLHPGALPAPEPAEARPWRPAA